MPLSRRQCLLLAPGLGGLVLTAACGGVASPTAAPPTPAATTAAASPAAGAPAATGAPTVAPAGAASPATAAPAAPKPAASPAAASPAATASDRPLRVGLPFFAAGLDPVVGTQASSLIPMGMGETLMRLTRQGVPAPWLAEAVEPVEAARWRVRLRAGVTFWNGKPVDAAAVKRSLERSVAKSPAAASLLSLAAAEVADPRTLLLQTKTPNGGMLATLTSFQLVIHDAEEAATLGDAEYQKRAVMTGPFQPTDFQPSEFAAVRRYERYWGGLPALARAEFRRVPDGNARLAGVLAGDLDIARNLPPQGVAQARAGGLTIATVGGANTYHIFLNNTRAPLDDLAVRRALNLAIDRQALVERVLGGGEVARGVYPTYLPFAGPAPLAFDPARARQILDAAGWQPGGDGIRAKEGRRLEFPTLTYPQRPELGLLATAIQAMLKEVGVAIAIQNVEDITKPVTTGDYTAAMYSLQNAPTGDPSYILNILYKSGGAWNGQIGYRSPALDALADRLTAESDPERRAALAREAQALLAEDVPVVYLMQPLYHTAHTAKLSGFEAHPVEAYLLHHRLGLA